MVEDVDESTRAGGCGQLHMFGAVEEKVSGRFSGMVGQRRIMDTLSSAMWCAVFLVVSNWEEKSGDLA